MTRVSPARLLQARLGANYSQDGLARAAGTSARNIARWEKGKHKPRAEFVAAIAEATDKPIRFFFLDDNADEEEESDVASDLLKSLRKIVQAEAKRVRKEERVKS